MAKASCSDQEFISLFKQHGAAETAKLLGLAVRNVYDRRKRLESSLAIEIDSPNNQLQRLVSTYPSRFPVAIPGGVVILGSDAHIKPDESSTAFRGYVKLAEELQPKLCVLNGDTWDYPSISRHGRIGWSKHPRVRDENEAVQEKTEEIYDACPKSQLLMTLGNHDARFENRLSERAPEYEDCVGTRLADLIPRWRICMSAWVNDTLVIKHRFKGGIHATHNNTLWAGMSMATGHLHSLKVTPFSDYRGTRYGIDTGTLSDPYGSHTDYGEDNPLNHRSGGIVLTFHRGKLLVPEIFQVVDENNIQFRGKVIRV